MGLIYYKDAKHKDYKKAKMYFEEALKYDENPEILYYLSDLLLNTEEIEGSNEYLSKALTMSYKMPVASYDLIPQELSIFI